jgi:GTP cyclohydrolase I
MPKTSGTRAIDNEPGITNRLGTEDVALRVDAKHLCVNSRGISDIEVAR